MRTNRNTNQNNQSNKSKDVWSISGALANADPLKVKTLILRLMFLIVAPWMLYYTASWNAGGLTVLLASGESTQAAEFVRSLGYLIATLVVVLQWHFNLGNTENRTLLLAGAAAYVYSIWTSFLGMGAGFIGEMTTEWVFANVGKSIALLGIAMAFDILPEIFIMFVLFGRKGLKTGDAVGAVIDMLLPGDQSRLWSRKNNGNGHANNRNRQPNNQPNYRNNGNGRRGSTNPLEMSNMQPTPEEIMALQQAVTERMNTLKNQARAGGK